MSAEQDSPNFVRIFERKVASITPLSDAEGTDLAWDLGDVGIIQLKRRMPAIIFDLDQLNPELDNPIDCSLYLWVGDLNEIRDLRLVHKELESQLRKFLQDHISCPPLFINPESGYVIEDNRGNIYLAVSSPIVNTIQGDVRHSLATTDSITKFLGERWINLIKRYSLAKIIGNVKKFLLPGDKGYYPGFYNWVTETVLNLDLVGKWREDGFIYMFAEEYGMSNFQFMRFRSFISAANRAQTSIVYDQVAREIIESDNSLST